MDDLNEVSTDQKPSFKKVVELLVRQYTIMSKANPNAGEKVTEMLIEHGAKVNAEDNDEMTPLSYSLLLGNLWIDKVFIFAAEIFNNSRESILRQFFRVKNILIEAHKATHDRINKTFFEVSFGKYEDFTGQFGCFVFY